MKNKNNILIILLILIFAGLTHNLPAQDDECITINTNFDLELGKLVEGTHNTFLDEQVIKFEIIGCKSGKVRISKIVDISSNEIDFETEWKTGPYTGFENNFIDNDIYELENKKYYVTIKINSIYIPVGVESGDYSFYPTIKVEYIE